MCFISEMKKNPHEQQKIEKEIMNLTAMKKSIGENNLTIC